MLLAGVSAFCPAVHTNGLTKQATKTVSRPSMTLSSSKSTDQPLFADAMNSFAQDFPEFYEAGWGPTVKAERWNGRHAMFGWAFILATGYAKAHGLIPNPEVALNLKQWGTLAVLAGPQTISNERAVVLIANVHALFLSLMAAFAPLSFQDPLLIPKGKSDEKPAGLFPALNPGLTAEAELLNGRIAMLGLTLLVGYSVGTGTPVLEAVDYFVGGKLL